MATLIEDLTAAGLDSKLAEEIGKNDKAAPVLNAWREGGLRQSDYDRKMNLGKAEVAAEKQRLAEQTLSLETDRTRMNEQFLQAQRDRESADEALARTLARAKTASAVYGVDLAKELFGDAEPGTPAPAKKADARTAPADAPDGMSKRMEDMERMLPQALRFSAEIQDIAIQHAQLFPDRPLIMTEILEKSAELRLPPTKVWDNLFGATAKREELTAEKYRLEGEVRARTKFEQEQSKRAAAPFGVQTPPSPAFMAAENKQHSSPVDRARGMNEAVQRAAQALVTHKYAPAYTRSET